MRGIISKLDRELHSDPNPAAVAQGQILAIGTGWHNNMRGTISKFDPVTPMDDSCSCKRSNIGRIS